MNPRRKMIIGTVAIMLCLSIVEIALPSGPLRAIFQQCQNCRRQRAPHGVNVSRQRTVVRSPQIVAESPIVTNWAQPTCNGPHCNQWVQPTYFAPTTTYVPTQSLENPVMPTDIVSVGRAEPAQRSFDTDVITVAESSEPFRRSLFKATRAARKAGLITGKQATRLRVAMFSPAFRQHAKTLCLVQMASSDESDVLPRDSEGNVDETTIDWDGFAGFLERIVPVILQLLQAFGV